MEQQAAAPAPAAPAAAPAPTDQGTLQKTVMAGQAIMYNEKTRDYFIDGLKGEGAPEDILAAQVIGLMKLLDDKAKGKIPRQIIAPVAISLLVEAAHFAVQAGFFSITRQQLAVAAKKIIAGVMQQYGVLDEIKARGGAPGPAGQPAAVAAPAPAAGVPPAAPAPGGLIQSTGAP